MRLYHFTSEHHLHGIARFGLTVGDVPTDIHQWKGRCGVWLTSNDAARGHGLEGSSTDKSRYRLMVEVDGDDPALVKWQRTSPPAPSAYCMQGRPDSIRGMFILGSPIRQRSKNASTCGPEKPSRTGGKLRNPN
jgi:hypothetical protein